MTEVQNNKVTTNILENLQAHLNELREQSIDFDGPNDAQNVQLGAELNLDD